MSEEITNQESSELNPKDDCKSKDSEIFVPIDNEKCVLDTGVITKKSCIPKASGIKPPITKIDRPCHDHCIPKPSLPPDVKREFFLILKFN